MQRISNVFSVSAVAALSTLPALFLSACVEGELAQDTHTALAGRTIADVEVSAEPGALCPAPGTLGYHLAQVGGADRFRYDPVGELVERIRGRYDEDTGRFRWRERFHDDASLVSRSVRGKVVPGSDGQTQELRYDVTAEDVYGAVSVQEVEESWNGCEVERRTRPAGGTDADWLAHRGSYDGTTYTYVEEQVPHENVGASRIEVTGTVNPDGTWSDYYEGEPSYVEYIQQRTGNADGYLRVDWYKNYGDGIFRGTDEYFLDGTQHRYRRDGSDGDCPATYADYTVDRDGHGTGTATWCVVPDDDEWPYIVDCTLSLTPTGCTRTCADGSVGTCYFGRR